MSKTRRRDFLRNPLAVLGFYGIPALVLLGSGMLGLSLFEASVLWALGLAIMGTGCVLNAMRCRRVHCIVVGPFLWIMAAAILVFGTGLYQPTFVSFPALANTAVIGVIVLWVGSELIWGRYLV